MTVVLDINVLLDVFQNRQPHYAASAQVLSLACDGTIKGIFPAHGLTTLFYLVRKHGTRADAEDAVDMVLAQLKIGNLERSEWQRARQLPLDDFEDAVVATVAEAYNADFIVTRNESDFSGSPVPALSPAVFLGTMPAPQ